MANIPMNPKKEWRPGQPAEEELLEQIGGPDHARNTEQDVPLSRDPDRIRRAHERRTQKQAQEKNDSEGSPERSVS